MNNQGYLEDFPASQRSANKYVQVYRHTTVPRRTPAHSVDSGFSLRSQHADRIRWPSRLRHPQQRSVSDLEIAYSSKAAPPLPAAPPPPRTTDLEYFDNPAETLDFSNRLNAPKIRPDDEYYRHLTARSHQERAGHWQGLVPLPAVPPASHAPGLRRSRSLAVIREESNAAPLIPRARLVDKAPYKDRFVLRTKYHSKEDIEQIYNKSTASCYGAITDGTRSKEESTFTSRGEAIYEDTRKLIGTSNNINGWSHSSVDRHKKLVHHSDEIVLSRNPSEIDSLDSNYVNKNYNFEAHQKNTYKESSSDTTEPPREEKNQPLYEQHHVRERSRLFCDNKCTIERSKSLDDVLCSYNNLQSDVREDSYKERSVKESTAKNEAGRDQDLYSDREEQSCNSSSSSTAGEKDNVSETSYITISPLSTNDDSLGRLENLAVSLADKIDEYCENFIEAPQKSTNSHLNSKSYEDFKSIYTRVDKNKPKTSSSDSKFKYSNSEIYNQKNNSTEHYEHKAQFQPRNELKTRSLYRQSSSSRNITTEPFVYTLIENQYYSLPDINVGKSLKRSERIDEKLRQQDRFHTGANRLNEPCNNEPLSIQTEVSEEDENRLNETNLTEIPDCHRNEYETIREYPKVRYDCKPETNYETVRIEEVYSATPPPQLHTLHKKEKQLTQENHNCIDTYELKAVTFQPSDSNQNTARNLTNFAEIKLQSDYTDFSKGYRTYTKDKVFRDNKLDNTLLYESTDLVEIGKRRNKVTKHYSLRQREPTNCRDFILPNPPTDVCQLTQETCFTTQESKKKIQRFNSFNGRFLNYPSLNKSEGKSITILPLSGHQTIVVEPKSSSVKNEDRDDTLVTSDDSEQRYDSVREFESRDSADIVATEQQTLNNTNKTFTKQVPRVKRERSSKIAEVQNKFEKPPSRLIIRDKKLISKSCVEMSRPQILTITDTKKTCKSSCNNNNNMEESKSIAPTKMDINVQKNVFNVTEKVDNVVKTDIEYQEKLHSVKHYWSKLIDNQTGAENEEDWKKIDRGVGIFKNNPMQENKVKENEPVKIVDSIKKTGCDSEFYEDINTFEESGVEIPETITTDSTTSNNRSSQQLPNLKEASDFKSLSPDIEIVEIDSEEPLQQNKDEVKHATLIKAASLNNEENTEFDHIRYKVMKSDLFRKRIITSTKKEAQFDGLIQYLKDYSFQELLVNNNIVIIEPVRTKIEIPNSDKISINGPNRCRVTGLASKQNECKSNGTDGLKQRKSGLRKHFFYHPIRVNKEIIEEELPNPDTVKTVRNIFEGTLRMRRPGDNSDPFLDKDSSKELPKRVMHQKNLSIDSKLDSTGNNRRISKYLTIDTSYGHKKWDSVSLSSGVSSGDLSSNNEHDYDTDALSPYQQKTNNEQMYTSSSEEYLYESLNPNLCYESQYVSQDILQKIRECGTSITYYGGKVLNEKSGPAVSPMTKAIMDEIRGLQRNCCRDCSVCQTKCSDVKCVCLTNNEEAKMGKSSDNNNHKHCSPPEITQLNPQAKHRERIQEKDHERDDNYLGFKFKLVKSNSCSSRLELAGTGDDTHASNNCKFKSRKSVDDPPLVYDIENSVKTKIYRIESYKKGIIDSPFGNIKEIDPSQHLNKNDSIENNSGCLNISKDEKFSSLDKDVECDYSNIGARTKLVPFTIYDKKCTNEEEKINNRLISTEVQDSRPEGNCVSVAETIKTINDPKKHYYINSDNSESKKLGKFGEMEFEEFQVLDPGSEHPEN